MHEAKRDGAVVAVLNETAGKVTPFIEEVYGILQADVTEDVVIYKDMKNKVIGTLGGLVPEICLNLL